MADKIFYDWPLLTSPVFPTYHFLATFTSLQFLENAKFISIYGFANVVPSAWNAL